MRSPVTALVAVLLGLGVTACGSSAGRPAGQASTATTAGQPTSSNSKTEPGSHSDRDNDNDNNDDDWHVLNFGRPAGAVEAQAISRLVARYFAAGKAADGHTACSLLTPFVAESAAERIGHSPGAQGNSCQAALSKLFRLRHKHLLQVADTMKVMRVGVEDDRSLVALEVPAIHEARQVTARRVGGRWTMLTLLDGIIE